MRDKKKGLIPFCKQLLTNEALKCERDIREPRIISKEGEATEQILQEYEEYEKKMSRRSDLFNSD